MYPINFNSCFCYHLSTFRPLHLTTSPPSHLSTFPPLHLKLLVNKLVPASDSLGLQENKANPDKGT